jgi:hypothetical protein
MRDFAMVSPKFWIGETGRAVRAKGWEALIVSLYLQTAPNSNMLGLYYQPIEVTGLETGLGFEGASKGLRSCIEVQFCSFDSDAQMVWVHEMAAWQVGDSLKASDKRCAGVRKVYAEQIESPLLARFYEKYAHAFHLSEPRGFARDIEAPSEALACPSEARDKGKGIRDKENTHTRNAPTTIQRRQPSGAQGASRVCVALDPVRPAIEAICAAMIGEGLKDVHASNPELVALYKQGVDADEFRAAARIAASAGKGLAYALGAVKNRLADAATISSGPVAPVGKWDATRSGIESKGSELGLGSWDEAAFNVGKGESFSSYEGRVRARLQSAEPSL